MVIPNSQNWLIRLSANTSLNPTKVCYRVKRSVEEYGCIDVNIFPLVGKQPDYMPGCQSYYNTPELVLEPEFVYLAQPILSLQAADQMKHGIERKSPQPLNQICLALYPRFAA